MNARVIDLDAAGRRLARKRHPSAIRRDAPSPLLRLVQNRPLALVSPAPAEKGGAS